MKKDFDKKINNTQLISLEEARKILFTEAEREQLKKEYPKFREEMRKEVIREEMAKKIKSLRNRNGVTQEELAKSLKTSRTNIVSLESGRRILH